MASSGRKSRAVLVAGLLLLAAALAFVFVPGGDRVTHWLMKLWPVFLILAGVVRVMGFAVERKPRSPLGGLVLIVLGVLFLASRFHTGLNVIEVYGRYWLLVFGIYAAVELVRYYTHPLTAGPPPRLFSFGRLFVIALIIGTGVLANRVSASNSSVLSALRLPGLLGRMRDSVIGETFTFTDEPVALGDLPPGARVTVNNSYGNVRVTGGATLRARLVKGVRGWSEGDARDIAGRIRLVVTGTPEGLVVTTNRNEVNQQFTTDIQLEMPAGLALAVTSSYGEVRAEKLSNPVTVQVSHGSAAAEDVRGDVKFALVYSDASLSGVDGNVVVEGAKKARLAGINGTVELTGRNGSVELRDIAGAVEVDAPFSDIVAQGLKERARLRTEHASVRVTRAADLAVAAPGSDISLDTVNGNLRVSTSNSEVRLREVAGEAVLTAERSSLTADGLRGPLVAETSRAAVTVRNFFEAVRVRTSHADVTLVSGAEPREDIEVENSHGAIKLVLPASSRFHLDAASDGGRVRKVGFEGEPSVVGTLLGALLGDRPVVRLKTSYKNILVQAAGARQSEDRLPVD